jgi:hypothetical protein
MRKQFNYSVGDTITHHIFGVGKVIEITDKYTIVDYSIRPQFNMGHHQTGANVTANGKPAIEIVYDGPIGTYEIEYEFQARPNNPESSTSLRNGSITIAGKTEADAVADVKERVTAYKNYDSSFYINTVTLLDNSVTQ